MTLLDLLLKCFFFIQLLILIFRNKVCDANKKKWENFKPYWFLCNKKKVICQIKSILHKRDWLKKGFKFIDKILRFKWNTSRKFKPITWLILNNCVDPLSLISITFFNKWFYSIVNYLLIYYWLFKCRKTRLVTGTKHAFTGSISFGQINGFRVTKKYVFSYKIYFIRLFDPIEHLLRKNSILETWKSKCFQGIRFKDIFGLISKTQLKTMLWIFAHERIHRFDL